MKATYSKIRFSLYEPWTIVIQRMYKVLIHSSFYQVFLSRKKSVITVVNYCFIILNNRFISTLNVFMDYQMPIYTNIDSFMR